MRVYRWLLRLYPAALRCEYGAAMEETFARRLADARIAGGWRPAQAWTREVLGVIAVAISERSPAGARRRRHRQLTLDTSRKAVPMQAMRREIRYAARRLARNPAFTWSAVLTLALAIGANASIFAIVQHVVRNPLPYPDSDRIIVLDQGALGLNAPSGVSLTEGLYYEYLDRARSLERLALYSTSEATLTGHGEPERLRVTAATPSLASVLRVSPVLGRWFSEAEGEPGAARVAVLSHGLWLRRYGGDASILGQSVILYGVPTVVIGVMPSGFAFPDTSVDAWTPTPLARSMGFGIFSYNGIARLREGVTLQAARADLNAAIAAIPQDYPEYPNTIGYHLDLVATPITLKDAIVGRVALGLWILLASVGFVLLIACANVANLCLVRAEAQQRDIAIRRALGAGSSAVARYFLAESLLLSAAGGAIGFGLAWSAVRLLVTTGPTSLPRLAEVRIDGIVAMFTLLLATGVAIAFAVLPLLRPAPLVSTLQSGGRAQTASRGRHHVRHVLMGAQVALALVLLIFSGLMIRSFEKLRAIDPGFDPHSALTFRLGLPAHDYANRGAMVAAHHALLDRFAALPGVTAVSATSCLPLAEDADCFGNTLFVDGRPFPVGALPPGVSFRAVAADYFQTTGIHLIRGRGIDRHDVDQAASVVVINQELARVYFPNQDPIGQRIASSRPPSMSGPDWLLIVGIAGDTPSGSLVESRPMPAVYMPISIARGPETPVTALVGPGISIMSYVLRTTTPPRTLVPAVRRTIHEVDANLPIVQVRTLQEMLDQASVYMAFTMVLLAIAAAVALLLGVIGIYGVTSYIVSQRRAEIGLRLALGAEPHRVVAMIVRQGGMVALAGTITGLAAALAASRVLGSLLYGVSERDPGVFTTTTLALLAIALLACWLPARRAARLNPLDTLRAD
jgi:putative ABC transport system permease protein